MNNAKHNNGILITDVDFNIKNTFDCGQCFRFFPEGNSYVGVAFNKIIKLTDIEEGILIETTEEDFADIWRKFLDLDTDYEEIGNGFPKDNFTKAAVEFGRGLRILQQDPWEALCSFIISQCNNIPRIQGIIDKLCTLYGDKIIWQGKTLYTFPSAMVISTLTVDDLAPLKCGYRAPYIINAAKQVACGKVDFDTLSGMDTIEARKKIMELDGVGPKVADCFLLFGMHKLDAFPVDTWMKKAEEYYGGKFDPSIFGKYAGIAQQYIFYYARNGKGTEKEL